MTEPCPHKGACGPRPCRWYRHRWGCWHKGAAFWRRDCVRCGHQKLGPRLPSDWWVDQK